jgi:DNA helicase HerA-like ATPase
LGSRTIKDILNQLESGKKVIIDTSSFSDELELLIGSIIINEVFNNHRRYKLEGDFDQKPVISIVVEEAPRVLSQEVLKSGKNIYSIIAREGRKFKVGLIAITQLTSIIPKTVLANMNTKIILGNELSSERDAIIQSASQDLSSDDRNIASLDKGEAIISSNFTKFAIPIKIPLFEDYIEKYEQESKPKEETTFVG